MPRDNVLQLRPAASLAHFRVLVRHFCIELEIFARNYPGAGPAEIADLLTRVHPHEADEIRRHFAQLKGFTDSFDGVVNDLSQGGMGNL